MSGPATPAHAPALSAADGQQWLRLRELRVQRARQAVAEAVRDERQARAAVESREAAIERSRQRLAELARHWAGPGCPAMPRWGDQVQAHRDALADRLERDEYALLDERDSLLQAEQASAQRRAELLRAQAREAAVLTTLKAQRRDLQRAREERAEQDAEDACRVPR